MWLVFIQVIFVTMVYGPIAAYLVEAFPAKIRYTSLSLPYHIGNGVFGGLVPLVCVWIPAITGNPFDGLYYPITIAALTFIVGSIMLRETRERPYLAGGGCASQSPQVNPTSCRLRSEPLCGCRIICFGLAGGSRCHPSGSFRPNPTGCATLSDSIEKSRGPCHG